MCEDSGRCGPIQRNQNERTFQDTAMLYHFKRKDNLTDAGFEPGSSGLVVAIFYGQRYSVTILNDGQQFDYGTYNHI